MALEAPPRTVRCPACGQSHTLAFNFAGPETRCPGCGKMLRLELQADTPAPAPAREEQATRESTADLGTLRPFATPPVREEARRLPATGPVPARPAGAGSALPVLGASASEAPPASVDPLLETVLGKCQLLRRLGEGGMGTVYLARHLTLDVEVAVKVLPAALAQRDRAFVERFLREARTAAQVHHPNVVQVLDVDFLKGTYFIVMEYVEGETAGARLRRKRMLSERETVEIGLGVTAALEYARHKSIVHRDVKPENILISREGEVKLADLGLAKRVSGAAGSDLTLRDQALGTPFYISPEQATNARAADHRSDLYSLGATLFHLATGRPPFEGHSAFHTMTMHLNEPAPELRAFRAELSFDLAALIKRLLHKNPGERLQTAGEVYLALRALHERLAPEAAPSATWTGTLLLSQEGGPAPGTPPAGVLEARTPWAGQPRGPRIPATPAALSANQESHGTWPYALRTEIAPPHPRTPTEPGKMVVLYPVRRPSRFWLGLLFFPFLNGLALLWTGTVAKKSEWWYGGLAVLLLTLALGFFSSETPAMVGFWLLYLVALVHGLGIRREYEFRAMEAARLADEELQRSMAAEKGGAPGAER